VNEELSLEMIKELVNTIKNNDKLIKLNLSIIEAYLVNNKLNNEAIVELTSGIEESKNLTELSLSIGCIRTRQ